MTKQILTIQGRVLDKGERQLLREEAKMLVKMRLWSILTNTLKAQAQKTMFEKAETFDDMVAGKTMLYNIDIQEKIVAILENLTIN